jgi:hypothetical protein
MDLLITEMSGLYAITAIRVEFPDRPRLLQRY